jgi:hypothetical protein
VGQEVRHQDQEEEAMTKPDLMQLKVQRIRPDGVARLGTIKQPKNVDSDIGTKTKPKGG